MAASCSTWRGSRAASSRSSSCCKPSQNRLQYYRERRSMSHEERLPNVHPGDVIREDFLKPWGMTPYRLAQGLGISQTAVGEILAGKRAVTAATALRLSAFLGCAPRFWLGLQTAYDLEEA